MLFQKHPTGVAPFRLQCYSVVPPEAPGPRNFWFLPPFSHLLRRSAPCLDKPVLARNTHGSKAQHVTTMLVKAMLAMAKGHIKTNSMGLQHRGGGVCTSVLDTNPRGVDEGVWEEGGASKIFLHFGGIFQFPISF